MYPTGTSEFHEPCNATNHPPPPPPQARPRGAVWGGRRERGGVKLLQEREGGGGRSMSVVLRPVEVVGCGVWVMGDVAW